MRECLICGVTKENGSEKVTYDYCAICLDTDVEALKRIQLKREKEASRDPGKEPREANK